MTSVILLSPMVISIVFFHADSNDRPIRSQNIRQQINVRRVVIAGFSLSLFVVGIYVLLLNDHNSTNCTNN